MCCCVLVVVISDNNIPRILVVRLDIWGIRIININYGDKSLDLLVGNYASTLTLTLTYSVFIFISSYCFLQAFIYFLIFFNVEKKKYYFAFVKIVTLFGVQFVRTKKDLIHALN